MKTVGYLVERAMCEPQLEFRPERDSLSCEPLVKRADAVKLLREARQWFSRLSVSTDSLGPDYYRALRFLEALDKIVKEKK
jgi:hypothetical protein